MTVHPEPILAFSHDTAFSMKIIHSEKSKRCEGILSKSRNFPDAKSFSQDTINEKSVWNSFDSWRFSMSVKTWRLREINWQLRQTGLLSAQQAPDSIITGRTLYSVRTFQYRVSSSIVIFNVIVIIDIIIIMMHHHRLHPHPHYHHHHVDAWPVSQHSTQRGSRYRLCWRWR